MQEKSVMSFFLLCYHSCGEQAGIECTQSGKTFLGIIDGFLFSYILLKSIGTLFSTNHKQYIYIYAYTHTYICRYIPYIPYIKHTHLVREGTSTVIVCESIFILTFPYGYLMGKHSFSLAPRIVLFFFSWTVTAKNLICPIF